MAGLCTEWSTRSPKFANNRRTDKDSRIGLAGAHPVPSDLTSADVGADALTLLPGAQASRQWVAMDDETGQVSIFGFFDKQSLIGQAQSDFVELTITGKLQTGRLFYRRDEVQLVGKNN